MPIHRIKENLLHINHLRKFVGTEVIFEAIKSEFKLTILNEVSSGNILVLSPHIDDDIFGCGGTLVKHQMNGDNVKIVYFSGSKERQLEAKKATAEIKVSDMVFLSDTDNSIKASGDIISKLKQIIYDFKPNIIYSPSFLDPNTDHFNVTDILAESLTSVDFDGDIFSYEIWTPIFANRLISIDKEFEFKKKAILQYKSQLANRSYLSAITGLSQYRAGMHNVGTHAEAFFSCNKSLYLKLFKIISLK